MACGGEAQRAEIRRPGPGADGDRAQGIRLQAQRQAATHKLLGFIPWTRVSSAYGYSQALDGTWAQYRRETGNFAARRTDFSDAVDFVGWYHAKTADTFGVARNDTFNLYLAYYSGWTGYKRGDWQDNTGLQRYARETESMARNYAAQFRDCDR